MKKKLDVAGMSKLQLAHHFRVGGQLELARVLLRVAAREGDTEAMLALARSYVPGGSWGDGKLGLVESFTWLKKAAEAGCSEAMGRLARYLNQGHGCERDEEAAQEWGRRALASGSVLAMALCCEQGVGVPLDFVKAYALYLKAADGGNVEAQFVQGKTQERCGPNCWKTAVNWYTRAAERNHVNAQAALASLCKDGKGIPRDTKKAFTWAMRAALQGHVDSMYHVATTYLNKNKRTAKEAKGAREWVMKAAAAGHAEAQLLAERYTNNERDKFEEMRKDECTDALFWWEDNDFDLCGETVR